MMEFSPFDVTCMSRALQLARLGEFTAHPNPRVGCVIASNGVVIGEGYHHRAGEPHAEVNALRAAGDAARGAVAYVTLEPCNHQGRTGPCSQALIDAGVAEVVYGMADPHRTAAGGIEALREAGIRVHGPLLEEQARKLNAGFIKRCETGLPFVTLKLAMSLDGRTAMASGESQWITGMEARRDAHKLRARSGAIVTGIGSVLLDNPAMTVREAMLAQENAAEIAARQPLRVVVDSRCRTPRNAAIVQEGGAVLIVSAHGSAGSAVSLLDGYPANVEGVDLASEGRVDLLKLLQLLAARECNDVLVEAGARLGGAFLEAGLVDRLVIYMAAKLLGSDARPLLTLPFEHMAQAIDLHIEDIRAVGADWRITAIPKKR